MRRRDGLGFRVHEQAAVVDDRCDDGHVEGLGRHLAAAVRFANVGT